ITARSVRMPGPLLGADDVAGAGRNEAGPLPGAVVEGDQAVEADADAAEDATRPSSAAGRAPGGDTGLPEHGGDGPAGERGDAPPVELDGERRAGTGSCQLEGVHRRSSW